MKTQKDPCDPDLLRLLADDQLSPAELTGLEQHLERCPACRQTLDEMVSGDRCLTAARCCLLADETGPHDDPFDSSPALDFLAPSDWPDSLGRLGTYEIKGVLGRGGMAVVLKAFDPALNRNVAIKVLSPSLASFGASRKGFLREARAAAAVVHEHVVGVFAVVESAGLPFLVMEYVPGRSLQERLDKQGPLSLPEVLRIGMQTAAGLAAAHAQGLVHRDVKPANILLENGVERVRLTDFGLARAAADAALTHSGVVAGTPHYMAPEQASGETIDHRADLFSLGSTLYAMCAGHPPFRAETPLAVLRRVCDHQPRPLREINPDVPTWLEAMINRLTAKGPARRYQTATEVADLLERCLAHVQQPLTAPLPAELGTGAARGSLWRTQTIRLGLTGLTTAALVLAALALTPSQTGRSPGSSEQAGSPDPRRAEATGSADSRSPKPDEITQGFHEAWGLADKIETGLRPRDLLTGFDAVSSLAAELDRELRALENELASPGDQVHAYSSVRSVPKADERK